MILFTRIPLFLIQGDGTAALFYLREDVFTFSVHCKSNFPFPKQNSDLDVALKDHVEVIFFTSEKHKFCFSLSLFSIHYLTLYFLIAM